MNDTVAHETVDTDNSRRRLIAALVGGGIAAVVAPVLAGRSSALVTDAGDVAILNDAYALEARMAATVESAIAGLTSSADRDALSLVRDHHLGYAQAVKGLLGPDAVDPVATPFERPSGAFEAVARRLAELEAGAVSRHLGSIASITSAPVAALVTSIANVEARHETALKMVSGTSAVAASR